MCENTGNHVLGNGSAIYLGYRRRGLLHVRTAKIDRQTHIDGINGL